MSYIQLYRSKINALLNALTNKYPRVTAVSVDIHYPGIIDHGDNICCFPNLEPEVMARMRNSLKAKLEADKARKIREGSLPSIYYMGKRVFWIREMSLSSLFVI